MKKVLISVSFIIATLTSAQESVTKKVGPPEGKALVGDFYGTQIADTSESKNLTAAQLKSRLKKSKELKNVAVRGKVTQVCEKKGCWLTVETPDKEKFFVNMKDYAFFVPTALVGKMVVLQGDAQTKTVSIDEQKHYAKDAKKSQAEIDAISTPQQEIRFTATGIRVVK